MKTKDFNQKIRIDYPCRWGYRVIGSDEAAIRAAILELIPGGCDIQASRSSTAGKYCSLSISVQVEDEASRLSLYEALRRHPSVKVVL